MRYKLTSHSVDATATEGWSGVDEHDYDHVSAAIQWFATEAHNNPHAVHFIEDANGHELARYTPAPV